MSHLSIFVIQCLICFVHHRKFASYLLLRNLLVIKWQWLTFSAWCFVCVGSVSMWLPRQQKVIDSWKNCLALFNERPLICSLGLEDACERWKKKTNENEMLCCHLSQVKADRGTTDIAFKEKLITSACISHCCCCGFLLCLFF